MLTDWCIGEFCVFLFFSLYPFCTFQPFNNGFCFPSHKSNIVLLFNIRKNTVLKFVTLVIFSLLSSIWKIPPKQASPSQGERLPWSPRAVQLPASPSAAQSQGLGTRLLFCRGLPMSGLVFSELTYQLPWVWRIHELLELDFFISWSFLSNYRFQIWPTAAMHPSHYTVLVICMLKHTLPNCLSSYCWFWEFKPNCARKQRYERTQQTQGLKMTPE